MRVIFHSAAPVWFRSDADLLPKRSPTHKQSLIHQTIVMRVTCNKQSKSFSTEYCNDRLDAIPICMCKLELGSGELSFVQLTAINISLTEISATLSRKAPWHLSATPAHYRRYDTATNHPRSARNSKYSLQAHSLRAPVTLQAPQSRVPTFPRQIVFVIGISTPRYRHTKKPFCSYNEL